MRSAKRRVQCVHNVIKHLKENELKVHNNKTCGGIKSKSILEDYEESIETRKKLRNEIIHLTNRLIEADRSRESLLEKIKDTGNSNCHQMGLLLVIIV